MAKLHHEPSRRPSTSSQFHVRHVLAVLAFVVLWCFVEYYVYCARQRHDQLTKSEASKDTGRRFLAGPEIVSRMYTPAGQAHLAVLDLDPRRLAPLTHETQQWIYTFQHPARCDTARYLVVDVYSAGAGSTIHLMGYHAAFAWRNNRIILWGSTVGARYTDNKTCGLQRNWLCHFLPPSNCSLSDASARTDTVYVQDWDNMFNPIVRPAQNGATDNYYEYLPFGLLDLITAAGLEFKKDELKYWWMAQAAAYFARLNDEAIADVSAMRLESSRFMMGGSPNYLRQSRQLSELPLPRGVVSAFVRHGDKGSDMRLVPFKDYGATAEQLVRNAPFFLRRALFISSEDDKVFYEANSSNAAEGPAAGWATMWYDFPRVNDGGEEQMRILDGIVPRGRLIRYHLLQLLLHLECDAWIGTRASNWGRLIDELRSVWVDKYSQPFVEVGDLTLGREHQTYCGDPC